MVSYYDKLLIAIPVAMVAGFLLSFHPAVAIHQGLAIGSLGATVILIEATYRNPPTTPTATDVTALLVVAIGWTLTGALHL